MNLDKAEQNNKRLQEIDKAFHRHFGGESEIEDWSLINFEKNSNKIRMKFIRQIWKMDEENQADIHICNKIVRALDWSLDKYTKAWIWSTKL